MFRILLIENDPNYRRILSNLILQAGYELQCSETIQGAVSLMENQTFEMVITALSGQRVNTKHELNGIAFTKMLRASGNELPVMILSDLHDHRIINESLLAGADDCMKLPVDNEEFILRIKAILHRSHYSDRKKLSIGALQLDYDKKSVIENGQEIVLPKKEFELLFLLLSYPNQLFSREMLMNEIWGPGSESEATTVSEHLSRLRKHFQNDPNFQILTVRGCGYKAVPVPSDCI